MPHHQCVRYIAKKKSSDVLCMSGEFPHFEEEDQEYVNSIITPAALKTLLASEHSFTDLFTIVDQSFKNLRIFSMGPTSSSSEKVDLIQNNIQRSKFTDCYAVMQHWMQHNQRIIADGITDHDDLVNMSVCFHWDQISGKVVGYTMYSRFTDPENTGEAIVLAFFHAMLRRVVLLTIPGPEFRLAGVNFISKYGIVIPFNKACGWCGRAADSLKKCPCKEVRYCNTECQSKHWSIHKPTCSNNNKKEENATKPKKKE